MALLKRSLESVTAGLQKVLNSSDGHFSLNGPFRTTDDSFKEFRDAVLSAKELMAENHHGISESELKLLNSQLSALVQHLVHEDCDDRGHPGQFFEYLLEQSLMDLLQSWSARLTAVTELRRIQLHLYLILLSECRQQALQYQGVMRPLKRLMQSCARTDMMVTAEEASGVDSALVHLLMQLCVMMNSQPIALEQFLSEVPAKGANGQPRFVVFGMLLPYMHLEGAIGRQARDALLLCLGQLASDTRVLKYIEQESNFCTVLALGLSALYSSLPSTLKFTCDEWSSLDGLWKSVPGLEKFLQSLQFCNDVVQMSLPVISPQLVCLVRSGLLEQVIAPALSQTSTKAVTAAVAYLNLIVSKVTEPRLLREVLQFVFTHVEDGTQIVYRLIGYINIRDNQLSVTTLAFFHTLLDLNCEDVMLELALRYLMTGDHIPVKHWHKIVAPDLCNDSAVRFLSLVPDCCWEGEQMFIEHVQSNASEPDAASVCSDTSGPVASVLVAGSHSSSPSDSVRSSPYSSPQRSRSSSSVSTSVQQLLEPSERASLEAGYARCLAEAHAAVTACAQACLCWSSDYVSPDVNSGIENDSCDVRAINGWQDTVPGEQTPISERSPMSSLKHRTERADSTSASFRSLPSFNALQHAPTGQDATPANHASSDVRDRSCSIDSTSSQASSGFPSSGLFLAALMDKLASILTQNSHNALQVTSLITRLAHYPQPLLRSFLLSDPLMLKADVPSLGKVLSHLRTLITDMGHRYSDFPKYLGRARKTLLAREEHPTNIMSSPALSHSGDMGRTGLGRKQAQQAKSWWIKDQPSTISPNAPLNRTNSKETNAISASTFRLVTSSAEARAWRRRAYTEGGSVLQERSATLSSVKKKRPTAQMLFTITIFQEFLKEMAAIAQEHSVLQFGAAGNTL